jgi:hypothetical protein
MSRKGLNISNFVFFKFGSCGLCGDCRVDMIGLIIFGFWPRSTLRLSAIFVRARDIHNHDFVYRNLPLINFLTSMRYVCK